MGAQFPLSIAEAMAFCNRKLERKHILTNVMEITHSLIISPRRYGKTSLALRAIHDSRLPYAKIQLFNAVTNELIVKRFIVGLSQLLSQLLKPSQKALQKIGQWFTHSRLTLNIKGVEFGFAIEPSTQDPGLLISSLLNDIEVLLEKQKQSVIIFIDEFQDIVDADFSDELQAILRDFAQTTKRVSFIISGSRRHLLESIFDDRNKPFYKLFDRIELQRIEAGEYEKFIQKAAKKRWNNSLVQDVIDKILVLTECHAYSLNRLCNKLWHSEQVIALEDVIAAWGMILQEEMSSIANDLALLSKNQKLVLQAMSELPVLKEPTASSFLTKTKLSPGSIKLAITALHKYDYIEVYEGGYRIIDPMLKAVLQN